MCIYPPAFLPITGSCSYYIKVLAIPRTFLDTTAGSVWIVLSLSSLDYIYLAISWVMGEGGAAGKARPGGGGCGGRQGSCGSRKIPGRGQNPALRPDGNLQFTVFVCEFRRFVGRGYADAAPRVHGKIKLRGRPDGNLRFAIFVCKFRRFVGRVS